MIGLKIIELISCVWFTDWTSLTQLHGQGRLSTVAWIIKDLESDFRHSKRLLCMACKLRLAGDALTNTSHASNTQNAFSVWIWRKDVLLSWIHPIEDLSQHVALSYDKYLDVQIQELPTEDLCKTSPPAEKEASQAIVLNSFEPLVVFEQVYRTCLKMTNPQKSDVGCRYPLKLFNIISTMYCILPIQFDRCMLRRCRQNQKRQRPKTMQVSVWNFVTRPNLVASKSLDDWFEDDGTDLMCLVHRLDISQLHGQGRLSTVAWIIKDLESDFRQVGKLLSRVHEWRHNTGDRFSNMTIFGFLKCLSCLKVSLAHFDPSKMTWAMCVRSGSHCETWILLEIGSWNLSNLSWCRCSQKKMLRLVLVWKRLRNLYLCRYVMAVCTI